MNSLTPDQGGPPPEKRQKSSGDTETSEDALITKASDLCPPYRNDRVAVQMLNDAVRSKKLELPLKNTDRWVALLSAALIRYHGHLAKWLVEVGGIKPSESRVISWVDQLEIAIVCGNLERAKELYTPARRGTIRNLGARRDRKRIYPPNDCPDCPAVWAISAGHVDILKWLVKDVGVRLKYMSFKINDQKQGHVVKENGALLLAAARDHLEVVQWLCGPEGKFKPNDLFPRTLFPIELAKPLCKRWLLTRPDCYHRNIVAARVWLDQRLAYYDVNNPPSNALFTLKTGACVDLRDMDLGDSAGRLLAGFLEELIVECELRQERGPYPSLAVLLPEEFEEQQKWHTEPLSVTTILLEGNERITEKSLVPLAQACERVKTFQSIRVSHLHPRIYNRFLAIKKDPTTVGPFPTLFAIAMQFSIDWIRKKVVYKSEKLIKAHLDARLKHRLPADIYDLLLARLLPS